MKFYGPSNPLYLETDSSGIGIGPGLLQMWDVINWKHEKGPDNTALCPTTFASKSLSSAEQQYNMGS